MKRHETSWNNLNFLGAMPSVCPKMPPQVSCVAGTDDESEDGETETEPGRPYRSGSGSWHRQLSPCSVLSAASSGRLYAEPAQTLIFLDWDDTIFPCTEIFQKRHYSRKTREWTQCLVSALAALALAALAAGEVTLRNALEKVQLDVLFRRKSMFYIWSSCVCLNYWWSEP